MLREPESVFRAPTLWGANPGLDQIEKSFDRFQNGLMALEVLKPVETHSASHFNVFVEGGRP